MTSLAFLLVATVALVAALAATQLALLAFRNPFRSLWLRRPGADNAAAIAITFGVSLTFAFEISALVGIGVPTLIAILAAPVLVAGISWSIWRLLGCRERLRRADAGKSPFYLDGREPRTTSVSVGT